MGTPRQCNDLIHVTPHKSNGHCKIWAMRLTNEQQQKSVFFDQATALFATITERGDVLNTDICDKESVSITEKERKAQGKLMGDVEVREIPHDAACGTDEKNTICGVVCT